METTAPTLPKRIREFLSLPDEVRERNRYKADYISMYEYEDGSKSILLPLGKTTPPIWVRISETTGEN